MPSNSDSPVSPVNPAPQDTAMDLLRKKLEHVLKIPDVNLQAPKIAEWMNETPTDVVVQVLSLILKDAIAGEDNARSLLSPKLMTLAVLERLSPSKRHSLFSQAVASEKPMVAALFSDLPPHVEEPPLTAFRIIDVRPSQQNSTQERDPITLGERRSLAKANDLKILEKMLFDPDPRVVENLLNNPLILEEHVVRLTSRRPNRREVLRIIGTHPHWGKNLRVRLSLIRNPFTPPILSVLGLITLSIQDIKSIAFEGNLHHLLRDLAADIATTRIAMEKPDKIFADKKKDS